MSCSNLVDNLSTSMMTKVLVYHPAVYHICFSMCSSRPKINPWSAYSFA